MTIRVGGMARQRLGGDETGMYFDVDHLIVLKMTVTDNFSRKFGKDIR